MIITEQAATVLQEIDAALAICEKATVGKWQHDESEMPAGKVKHVEGYLVATCQMRPDATFIAASRTICPTALRCLKTAIHTLAAKAEVDTKLRGFTESAAINALTTLINQWNSK